MAPLTYSEDDLVRALQHIEETGESQAKTAKKFSVTQPQISRRLSGVPSLKESHEKQLKLPPDRADRLIEWILREEKAGYAPTHDHVRALVKNLLVKSRVPESEAVVRHNWISRFLERHKLQIHTKQGRTQEA